MLNKCYYLEVDTQAYKFLKHRKGMCYHIGPVHGNVDKRELEPISKEKFKELTKKSTHIVFGSIHGKPVISEVDYSGLSEGLLKKCGIYTKDGTIFVVGDGVAHFYSNNQKHLVENAANINQDYANLRETYLPIL
jgi:hypothetical protein